MKFHWFNLMPYPYLPDDFRQTHRSVWVDIDSRLYDPVKGHTVYNDYLDLLEFAAEQGFDRHHPRHRLALARRRLAAAHLALSQRGPQLAAPARLRLAAAASALHALSPLAVLARGFAVVHTADGRVLRDASDTTPGDELDIRLAAGSLRTRVLTRS